MHTLNARMIPFILPVVLLSGFVARDAPAEEESVASASAAPAGALAQSDSFPRNPTVAEQVAMLDGETLEQSLFRLQNVNLFFSPGPNEPGRIVWAGEDYVPLSEDREQFTVDVILGNRRVLKLFRELGALPPAKAAAHINEQLATVLAEYKTWYAADKEINSTEHFTKAGAARQRARAHNSLFGIGYISNTPNPNDTTLTGLRYAVLSLVWLAGALELEDAHPSVVMVAEEAIRQRDAIYGDEIHHDPFRASVLQYAALYNRMVLGNALLNTAPLLREEYEKAQDNLLERRIIRRKPFNTLDARVEAGPLQAGGIEMDYRTGFTDKEFDYLLQSSSETAP